MSWNKPLKRNCKDCFKLSKENIHTEFPTINGPPTTTNDSGNRQHRDKYIREWNSQPNNNYINRHYIYWLHYIIGQKYSHILWKDGKKNMANYFTNQHPIWHHRTMIFSTTTSVCTRTIHFYCWNSVALSTKTNWF